MFELAPTNIFTPELEKVGGTRWRFVTHCWQGLGLGGGGGGLSGWGRPGCGRRPGRRCWTLGAFQP